MNNTKLPVSLEDTTELRKLIIENPDLPLLIFCGPETNSGEYPYESNKDVGCDIQELTLYKDYWIPKDEYEEQLRDDLCDEEEYIKLTDELYKLLKQLRHECIRCDKINWSNITISIENVEFLAEYNCENLINSRYSNEDRMAIWQYKYLNYPIERFNKDERNLIPVIV